MKLPEKLKEMTFEPLYRTYPELLTFEGGGTISVRVTAKDKAYFAGQLEREIMHSFNADAARRGGKRVTSVRVFRNSSAGGVLVSDSGHVVEVY